VTSIRNRGVDLPHQALVDELADAVEHAAADLARRTTDRLELVQPAACNKHGAAREQRAHPRFEQVVAPSDRATQRALSVSAIL